MADRTMKQLKAQINRARKRRKVVAASIHLDAQCIACGTWYKLSGPASWSGRRTCSDQCRKDLKARRAKDWYAEQGGGIVSKDCEHCGETYSGIARSMARRKFCSRQCNNDAVHLREREARLANNLKANKRCLHCGSVVPATMRSDAAYCSRRCTHAAHGATKKARMKIMVDDAVKRIPRAYIIERDNSRCHMCRKKCKPSEIHLDHVIPLSKGGTHTLENLRVSCAPCNLSKGDRECNEQLMLVG